MSTYPAFNGSLLLILLLVLAGIVVLATWPTQPAQDTEPDERRTRLDEITHGYHCTACRARVTGTALPPATWLCETCEHDLDAWDTQLDQNRTTP